MPPHPKSVTATQAVMSQAAALHHAPLSSKRSQDGQTCSCATSVSSNMPEVAAYVHPLGYSSSQEDMYAGPIPATLGMPLPESVLTTPRAGPIEGPMMVTPLQLNSEVEPLRDVASSMHNPANVMEANPSPPPLVVTPVVLSPEPAASSGPLEVMMGMLQQLVTSVGALTDCVTAIEHGSVAQRPSPPSTHPVHHMHDEISAVLAPSTSQDLTPSMSVTPAPSLPAPLVEPAPVPGKVQSKPPKVTPAENAGAMAPSPVDFPPLLVSLVEPAPPKSRKQGKGSGPPKMSNLTPAAPAAPAPPSGPNPRAALVPTGDDDGFIPVTCHPITYSIVTASGVQHQAASTAIARAAVVAQGRSCTGRHLCPSSQTPNTTQ
ncbi:hypothetical protein H4582DRAFT_2063452, partial [Lactarius indigo]